MKNRNLLLILLCVVLTLGLFGLTGCSKYFGTEEPDDSGELKEQEYRVALFFANGEYIANGDESLEKFVVIENEITALPGDVYIKTLELLKVAPEESCSTVITDQVKFNDVYIEGDTINVDLDSNGLNGGPLEETFLISQIVNTLINSFDEVKQVQFLVDGEVAETLMGHVDVAAPFAKDLFTE